MAVIPILIDERCPSEKVRVHYFLRRSRDAKNFSIERLFESIIAALPAHIEPIILVCPLHSDGVLQRLRLIIWAAMHQGPINHITGDIEFIAAFMSKRRTIVTIHDCGSLHRLSGVRKAIYKLFWLRIPFARSAVVTTISDFTREQLYEVLGHSKAIEVIGNCTTIASREPKSGRTEVVNKPLRILQVGTAYNKNVRKLIEACHVLPVRIVLIGHLSEEQKAYLRSHRCDYENYENVSPDRLIEEYEKCDLVTFVSTFEGFGLPILEAQAVGRPIITSNREPMKSIAGDGAILVDPDNIIELREAIVRLGEDKELRARLIVEGANNVKNYTPTQIALRYASLYETLSKGARSMNHPQV
jgi:glycosyltransferase involved in cell wall biosynthesis